MLFIGYSWFACELALYALGLASVINFGAITIHNVNRMYEVCRIESSEVSSLLSCILDQRFTSVDLFLVIFIGNKNNNNGRDEPDVQLVKEE